MAQVRKRLTEAGEARYDVRVRVGGRTVSKTFRRRRDAEGYAASIEADKLRGALIDPRAGRVSFEEWATRWLEQRHDLRPRTVDEYRSLLRTHLLPAFGATSVQAISPSSVRAWYASLAKRYPARAAKAYRLLHVILATAVTDQLLLVNPCQVKGAGVERARERPIPTVAEVQALADAMPGRLRAAVLLAAWCGLRRGEVLGLTRADLDLLHGTVRVERAVSERADGTLLVGDPKTDAGRRSVTIPPHIVPALEDHLAHYVDPEPEAPLFPSREGSWLRPGSLQEHWNRARVAVGVRYVFHDLRHFGATMAAATGASTREIMARIGHASPRAALRYQHATEDRNRFVAERLAELARAPVVELPRHERDMERPEESTGTGRATR
jgi:integrase